MGRLAAMKVAYPFQICQVDGGYRVTFRDVPEATAEGVNHRTAKMAARERLCAALQERVRAHRDIPQPTPARRRADLLELPVLITAKLVLYQTMRDQNVSNVALAERLGTVEGTVRRLLDLRHRSHIDGIEEALAELGKRLVLSMWRS